MKMKPSMKTKLKPAVLLALAACAFRPAFADMQIVARERESGWPRIGYVLRPTTSSYIRCELALPDPGKWDGRLWGHGDGLFARSAWAPLPRERR